MRLGAGYMRLQPEITPAGTYRIQVPPSPLQPRSSGWPTGVRHNTRAPLPPLRDSLPFGRPDRYPVRWPNRFTVLY